jgi:hypothetical protein
MSASIETQAGLLRGAVDETAKSAAQSALRAQIRKYRRLFLNEHGCEHDQLEFDDINDVYCKNCGKDLTD